MSLDDLPPIMYRFLDEQRVRELLAEHDTDGLAEELTEERFGKLQWLLREQARKTPRR